MGRNRKPKHATMMTAEADMVSHQASLSSAELEIKNNSNIRTPKNNKFSICSKWKIHHF